MIRIRHRGARLAVDRLQPQPPHPVTPRRYPFPRQMPGQLPTAVERILQVQLVDAGIKLSVAALAPCGR